MPNNKGKAGISGYQLLIFLFVVPLACAIGVAWLGYPNPWLYIPGAFVGAFIGVIIGVMILAGSKPGRTGKKTKKEEYEEKEEEGRRRIGKEISITPEKEEEVEGRRIGKEISIAQSKEDADTSNNDPQDFDLRCTVCGRPGYVQPLPNAPISLDCFCDEHSSDDVFYPSIYVFPLFVLGLLIGIGWLIYRWIF